MHKSFHNIKNNTPCFLLCTSTFTAPYPHTLHICFICRYLNDLSTGTSLDFSCLISSHRYIQCLATGRSSFLWLWNFVDHTHESLWITNVTLIVYVPVRIRGIPIPLSTTIATGFFIEIISSCDVFPATTANELCVFQDTHPDSKVHGTNVGPIWGRQDPGGPHVGPVNFVICAMISLER